MFLPSYSHYHNLVRAFIMSYLWEEGKCWTLSWKTRFPFQKGLVALALGILWMPSLQLLTPLGVASATESCLIYGSPISAQSRKILKGCSSPRAPHGTTEAVVVSWHISLPPPTSVPSLPQVSVPRTLLDKQPACQNPTCDTQIIAVASTAFSAFIYCFTNPISEYLQKWYLWFL